MNPVSSVIDPDAKLRQAIDIMADHDHSCVVVVDVDNQPLGVVTERDVVKLVSKHQDSTFNLIVGDMMSSPPVTVLPTLTIHEGLNLARARKLRHLLVVDEHRRLIGIVTQTDMVRAYLQQMETYRQELEAAVKSRTEELEIANRRLLDLALEDSLTKIGNRRAMEIDLAFTQTTAERYGEKYQVALLDIDFFKSYNDCYGHQAGDRALRDVTRLIKNTLRDSDRLYRYGGEEFLLLLSKVSSDQAANIANRARINIFDAKIKHEQSPFKNLTVSGGVAAGSASDWKKSVKLADEALYRAKSNGRNQVVAVKEI